VTAPGHPQHEGQRTPHRGKALPWRRQRHDDGSTRTWRTTTPGWRACPEAVGRGSATVAAPRPAPSWLAWPGTRRSWVPSSTRPRSPP